MKNVNYLSNIMLIKLIIDSLLFMLSQISMSLCFMRFSWQFGEKLVFARIFLIKVLCSSWHFPLRNDFDNTPKISSQAMKVWKFELWLMFARKFIAQLRRSFEMSLESWLCWNISLIIERTFWCFMTKWCISFRNTKFVKMFIIQSRSFRDWRLL